MDILPMPGQMSGHLSTASSHGGQRSFLRLHPLSLLAQARSQGASGCLQVYSGVDTWSVYLEDGELVYASKSQDPFERLDRHLRQLSRQVPSLVSAVRVQVRLLFESRQALATKLPPDFQAIQWLVEQQYLTPIQVALLIESLAREVLASLLPVTSGNYDLIPQTQFEQWTNLGRLDLRSVVEQAQQLQSMAVAGSTVVQLPTATAVGEIGSSDRPEDQGGTGDSVQAMPARQQYRIVCIDDSPTILKLIESYLQDESFSVLMISDPVRALMQVVRYKPELILLDVEMPNMDGYEFCSLLRRHPLFKTVPIVMVTSNTGFIDRARAKLVGASGYLTKPFTQSELLKIVFKNLPTAAMVSP